MRAIFHVVFGQRSRSNNFFDPVNFCFPSTRKRFYPREYFFFDPLIIFFDQFFLDPLINFFLIPHPVSAVYINIILYLVICGSGGHENPWVAVTDKLDASNATKNIIHCDEMELVAMIYNASSMSAYFFLKRSDSH